MQSIKKIIIISILFCLPALLYLSPLPIEPSQKMTLGLILMALGLWITELIPLYATGLLILLYEVIFLTPVLTIEKADFKKSVFYAPYFSDTIALFMGGLLLAQAIGKYNIDKWLLNWVMKKAGSKPANILLVLLLTVALLSMWISNTAATALGLILIASLKDRVEDQRLLMPFFLGIPFSANLGGMATPVGTPPNAIAMAILRKENIDISFGGWMLYMLPLVAIVLFFLWRLLIYKYTLPAAIEKSQGETEFSLNNSVKFILILFFLTVGLWLTSPLHGIPDGIVALIPATFFLAFGILNTRDFRSISWDVLFLVGGGMALSVALTETGTGKLLADQLKFGTMHILLASLIFAIIGVILSNSMSNTATANLILPIVALTFLDSDLFPMMATTVAVSSAMSLPVSTPPNALAYSSGTIPVKDMIITGTATTAISLLAVFLPGYIWIPFVERLLSN